MLDTKGGGASGAVGGGPRGGFPGGGAVRGGRMRIPSRRTSPRVNKPIKKTTNKNAPRTRVIVTTKTTAGSRTGSTRTSPRTPIVGRKVPNTKKVLKGNGKVKVIKLGRGNAIAATRKETNAFVPKSKTTVTERKAVTPDLKKFLSENKKSIRKSRTTPQKRLQKNANYWTRQNVPKSVRNDKVKLNKYADNAEIRALKRKLNRIAQKGGF